MYGTAVTFGKISPDRTNLIHPVTAVLYINYTKIFDRRTLGRPIQVNGAFFSIKKSRVMNTYI